MNLTLEASASRSKDLRLVNLNSSYRERVGVRLSLSSSSSHSDIDARHAAGAENITRQHKYASFIQHWSCFHPCLSVSSTVCVMGKWPKPEAGTRHYPTRNLDIMCAAKKKCHHIVMMGIGKSPGPCCATARASGFEP